MVRARPAAVALQKSGLCKAWAPLGRALRAWHEAGESEPLLYWSRLSWIQRSSFE